MVEARVEVVATVLKKRGVDTSARDHEELRTDGANIFPFPYKYH